LLPARLRVAVADVPDETRGTLDSVVLPSRKLTDPAGAADPLAGFTVAVSVVLAVVRMAAGAADRSVVVAITGCVTAIVVVAAEPANVPVGVKLAPMVLEPVARLAALTVKVAEEEVPETSTGAEPNLALPTEKDTVPVGLAEPVTALTIAVNCVVPVAERDVGQAVRVVVVPEPTAVPCHFTARL
jgi:hypothetical protein